MYAKLVLRNARRSVRDYLIYLVTMTICVTLFYAFLSISSDFYRPDIGSEYEFSLLSDGMKVAICAITLLLLFLIRFVNRYMLRRRQKEFAVQAMLGMEQRTIGRLFFAETLLMGLLAIAAGIVLGVFCSQFITAMMLTAYGAPYTISWTLFPDTALLTVAFFVLSFLLVGLWNARTIRRTKVVDMLTAARRNETEWRQGRWISVVTVLFLACAVWMLVVGIRKLYFYYDSRLALPVRLLYWGNVICPALLLAWPVWCRCRRRRLPAALPGLLLLSVPNTLLAASVPAMMGRYELALGAGMVNQYLVFVVVNLLFILCAVIYLAAGALAAWKARAPEHRYRGENLFFFGQILSKLNTTSKTMTLVSMTLVLAIFLFLAAPVLVGWASGYLEIRALYDVQISSRYNDVHEEAALPRGDYAVVTEILAARGVETAGDCTFSLHLPRRADFHSRVKYDFPVAAIALRDYNAIRAMLGYEPIALADDEFTTQWQTIATDGEREAFLRTHGQVETDAGTLTLADRGFYQEPIGETVYNSYTNVVYVFPDAVCEQLLPVMRNRYITTEDALSYDDARALERVFTEAYPEQAEGGAEYAIRLRTLQVNTTKASNFVLQASMVYGAVVLMVICLTVLSLQQLLDADRQRYRFSVLRKLGVEERRINCLVLRQLSVSFGLPVGTAVLVAAVVVAYFLQAVSAEIAAYVGPEKLLPQLGATVAILLLLLLCYFVSTWLIFRRSVDARE